jgi:hypothetical protein
LPVYKSSMYATKQESDSLLKINEYCKSAIQIRDLVKELFVIDCRVGTVYCFVDK